VQNAHDWVWLGKATGSSSSIKTVNGIQRSGFERGMSSTSVDVERERIAMKSIPDVVAKGNNVELRRNQVTRAAGSFICKYGWVHSNKSTRHPLECNVTSSNFQFCLFIPHC
jgi:hypothetical protein